MTHMPPQFRENAVLVEEWRYRAAELRRTNTGAADVYERCADELEQLDVQTERNPAHLPFGPVAGRAAWMRRRTKVAMGLGAAGVALFFAARERGLTRS
jgi:hypothetical protein